VRIFIHRITILCHLQRYSEMEMGAMYLRQHKYISFSKTTYFELLVVFPNPCDQIMRYPKILDYLSYFPFLLQ
jgi:hypothetical protein